MKKIEVTAQFTATGKIIPLNFNDGNNLYRVHSTGRHWENELGKHFLVMDIRQKNYHLILNTQDCIWYLANGSQSPSVPV